MTASAPLRLGVVGTENSHVDHILQFLNSEDGRPGVRVGAIAGGPSARNLELARSYGVEVVDTVHNLAERTDALIVTDRHGGLHREHALPFLQSGRPVLIDKPLACDPTEATEILTAARHSQALVTSYSALRYQPDTEELVSRIQQIGPLRAVVLSGPADPDSEYGGLYFYGIHVVDVALRLVPGELGAVRVDRSAGRVTASTVIDGTHVTIHFIGPGGPPGAMPFHAVLIGAGGVCARDVRIEGNYVAPGLNAFLDMVEGRRPAIADRDLMRPIELLHSVVTAAALNPTGAPGSGATPEKAAEH